MTGARLLADTVHGYGLTHAFFMPFISPRSLGRMQDLGLTTVQSHGEKAAAYMADGYARARGGPGLCMCQAVGALNLAAGLQDAWLAQAPVIAITGRELQAYQTKKAYQDVDHVKPFTSVAKASFYVPEPSQFPQALRQAFRTAVSGAPGPVHIDIEGRTGTEVVEFEADMDVVIEPRFATVPPFRPEADAADIAEALRVLGRAKRPIIVAGGGVTASGARAELIALAEKLSIPVATALNAKAMFPSDHPLAVGVPGAYSRACANKALCEADLVFYIGSQTGSQVTNYYTVPPADMPTIQLNIDAQDMGRNFRAEVGLLGDAKATLRRMIEMAGTSPPRDAWLARVGQLVDEWKSSFEELRASDVVPIRPERLCREISKALPSNAILVSDTGHSGIWTGAFIDLTHPDQMYLRCAGSLGWGLPAAIGAKCAQPDRPVVLFSGDGGFWYHLQELDTARRYGINVVAVVNNNHSLNQEKGGNERILGGRSAQSDSFWLFGETDFARVAESFGCIGIVVTRPWDLAEALKRAFAADRPVVIDVRTNLDGIAPLGWVPS